MATDVNDILNLVVNFMISTGQMPFVIAVVAGSASIAMFKWFVGR